jgi:hypothetical protein
VIIQIARDFASYFLLIAHRTPLRRPAAKNYLPFFPKVCILDTRLSEKRAIAVQQVVRKDAPLLRKTGGGVSSVTNYKE